MSDPTECKLTYDQAIRVLSTPFIEILKRIQKGITKHNIKSSIRLAVSGRRKENPNSLKLGGIYNPILHSSPPDQFFAQIKPPLSMKYILGLPGIYGTNLFFNANGTKARIWYEASNALFVNESYDINNPTEELLTGETKRIVLSIPYDLLKKKWKHYIISEFRDFADPNQYDPDNIVKLAVNLILKMCEANDMLNKECQYIIYEKMMSKGCSLSDLLVMVRKP